MVSTIIKRPTLLRPGLGAITLASAGTTLRSACFALVCFALLAFAQEPSQPAAAAKTNPAAGAANTAITLDVAVTNQSGQGVPGLQAQDFTLLDNKLPQKITSFAAEGSPNDAGNSSTQIVLVLDQVNTSVQQMSTARQELGKYLKGQTQLAQPTSILFFSDSGAAATKATKDPQALLGELQKNPQPLREHRAAQGEYGAIERFNSSLRTLGQLANFYSRTPGHKLVIWIGSGWSFLSNSRIDIGYKDQQAFFSTMISLSAALRQARVTLYQVDPIGSGGLGREYYKGFIKPITSPRQIQDGGNLALQVFAYQSGGLVINSSNDLAAEIAKCVAQANSFYALSFEPAPADAPNQYHALEVKLSRPGLTARTRTGYYAQPAQPSSH
jgi:VWFA-related protein